jgi:5-methylcytosine-specific restriction endonuclease McrA
VKRKRIKSRINQNDIRSRGFCENCGTTRGCFEVHHKLRRSQGGGDETENLSCLCSDCHRAFHDGRLKLHFISFFNEPEVGENVEVRENGVRISKEENLRL